MTRILLCAFACMLTGCGLFSKGGGKVLPKAVEPANACGTQTSIRTADLEALGLEPEKNKVTIVRVIRSTCPYCKQDLMQLGLRYKDGRLAAATSQVLIIGYKKKGVETRKSFDTFVRERLNDFAIPPEAIQMVYLDKTYKELLEQKTKSAHLLFADWKAVPYGLVFGKDGRLVYRRQFTMTPELQDSHYAQVVALQKEVCPP